MGYREQLLDPRWQKKRLEILQRDNWACVTCGVKDKTLHVHHGYYERGLAPWEYPNATLHTVCGDCHLSWQKVTDILSMMLASMRPNGVFVRRVLECIDALLGEEYLAGCGFTQEEWDVLLERYREVSPWIHSIQIEMSDLPEPEPPTEPRGV